MSFVVTIAHDPKRPLWLVDRLIRAFGNVPVIYYSEPGKPHEWSIQQWQLGLDLAIARNASHVVVLNDDMIPCANVGQVVSDVLTARPNHLVSFYNTTPVAKKAQEMGLAWITSPEGLIGNAYALPVEGLRAFLDWRATLAPTAFEALSEDQMVNLWAMATGALVWHTVPALFDHDTTIPSCYGNVQLRKPTVGPHANVGLIDWNTDALHQGRLFNGNHQALLKHVPGDRVYLVKRYYELAGDVPR